MEALALLIGLIVVFLGGCAVLAKGLEHLAWIRAGRPSLSKSEHLQYDLLRYNGLTSSSALRRVLDQRNTGYRKMIEQIRDVDDMIHNPDRAQEAAEELPAMTEAILAKGNDDPTKQQFVEAFLEHSDHEMAPKMREAMKDPATRVEVTAFLSHFLQQPAPNE